MLVPVVDWNLCQGCNPCTARLVCKTRALVVIDEGDPPYVEMSRCSNCANCVLACNYSAISMKQASLNGGNGFGR